MNNEEIRKFNEKLALAGWWLLWTWLLGTVAYIVCRGWS